MSISVSQHACVKEAEVDLTIDILCQRYLPRVFQYISYWGKNAEEAEELTLLALKKNP